MQSSRKTVKMLRPPMRQAKHLLKVKQRRVPKAAEMSLLPLKSLRVQRPEFKSTVTGLPVTNKRGGA